jgi:hypothetical protein
MVTVIKIRSGTTTPYIYIGRDWAGHPQSVLHNPFHVGKDGNREEVLLKFIEYFYAPEQWKLRRMAFVMIQQNDVLGCWCKPKECHGDIIAGYLNWKYRELQDLQDRCLFHEEEPYAQ